MANLRLILMASIALGCSTLVLAADAPAPEPTKAARETMAKAHEKMAACLRSEREIAACRSEMMQSCKEAMGGQGCGMGMGMGKGMMGEHGPGKGMQNPPATKTP